MAWIKEVIEERTGAIVPFWEVMSVVYNHKLQQSDLTVGGWASAETYAEGKDPMMQKSWSIPSGLAPELASGAVAFVSSYARSQDEFEGAEDA